MGVGGGKLSPISGSGGSGVRESLTLASCKVFKGAGSARRTSRDAAVASLYLIKIRNSFRHDETPI